MVGRAAGQVARMENQDLLRHAADGPGIRAFDVALRAALAATGARARAHGDHSRGQADAAGSGGIAAAGAAVRVTADEEDKKSRAVRGFFYRDYLTASPLLAELLKRRPHESSEARCSCTHRTWRAEGWRWTHRVWHALHEEIDRERERSGSDVMEPARGQKEHLAGIQCSEYRATLAHNGISLIVGVYPVTRFEERMDDLRRQKSRVAGRH